MRNEKTDMLMNSIFKYSKRVALIGIMASVGCTVGDAKITQPAADLATLPWKLTLNHHAVVTTRNTPFQLSYQVTNVYGDVLTDLPPVEYTTSDTSVKVDATGKVTVSTVNSLRYVWATMKSPDGTWKVADTVRIAIEDSVYTFDKFKMALTTDTVVPANRVPSFPARLFRANGDTVRTPAGALRAPHAYYVSTAPNNIFYQGNRWTTSVTPRNLGETTIYATSYIFGTEYKDSIRLRAILPDSVVILIHRQSTTLNPSPSVISQPNITVLKNGKVLFRNNNTTAAADIVFDNQAAVIGGNIPTVPTVGGAVVTFPNVGEFTYRSAAIGPNFVGKVTVVDR
jgi:hypothetical protein